MTNYKMDVDYSQLEMRILSGVTRELLLGSMKYAPYPYALSNKHLSMRDRENASPGYLRVFLKHFLGWSNKKIKRTRLADQKAVWR